MFCNQYLEGLKIDLMGLGYASAVRKGWQASAMKSIEGKWFPPLHKLNATLRFNGIFRLPPIPIAQNFVVCLIRCVTSSE